MPQSIRAVVVDPSSEGRLALRDVELPAAGPDDLTVRVTAISLNRGEVNRALSQSEAGARPGWDFAGVVEQSAADRSGPAAGTRVVGMLPSGAWAERLRAPSYAVAALPDGVSDAQAATLPVAGLTALHALRQGGLLLGRKVLVDGATGGVGHLAVQLAAASGATVYGHVRRAQQKALISEWCGDRIIVSPDLRAAASGAAERHLRAFWGLGIAHSDVRKRRILPAGWREALRPDPVPRASAYRASGGGPCRACAGGCPAQAASAYRDRSAVDGDRRHRPPPDRSRVRRQGGAAREMRG
jgi:threonine dehydrogenase-like Zn-dependent dehydrogenase